MLSYLGPVFGSPERRERHPDSHADLEPGGVTGRLAGRGELRGAGRPRCWSAPRLACAPSKLQMPRPEEPLAPKLAMILPLSQCGWWAERRGKLFPSRERARLAHFRPLHAGSRRPADGHCAPSFQILMSTGIVVTCPSVGGPGTRTGLPRQIAGKVSGKTSASGRCP